MPLSECETELRDIDAVSVVARTRVLKILNDYQESGIKIVISEKSILSSRLRTVDLVFSNSLPDCWTYHLPSKEYGLPINHCVKLLDV